MNIKYLSSLHETEKLHREYAIFGLSSAALKELKLDKKRKKKKLTPGQAGAQWKKVKEVNEWKDKILIHWNEKYHDMVFTLNKMPETGKIRRKLDVIYQYVFSRKWREANGKKA